MRAIECPVCGHGFVMRRRRRCPKCSTFLVYEGERFVREDAARVFLWLADRETWSEVSRP